MTWKFNFASSMKSCFTLLLFILLAIHTNAQYTLQVLPVHSNESSILERLKRETKLKTSFADELSGKNELNKFIAELFSAGYLSANIDSVVKDSTTLKAYCNVGETYRWAKLHRGNADEGMLSEIGYRDRFYRNKTFDPAAISRLSQRLLNWFDNNGYPFALFRLDSITVEQKTIEASIYIERAELIHIDTLIIRGSSKLSRVYIYNYLGIEPGDIYNESVIKKIPTRLKELPFVTESKPFQIEFTENKARLILNLENKKASQLNGVVGVIPDSKNAGKINVTGDIKIRLQNSFGRAELFDLNWSNPQPKSQDLKVKLNVPFVLNSPFGIDATIGIYKKDTTYLEFNRQLGLQYYFSGTSYVKVFAGKKSSNLISVKGYEFVQTLPPFADVASTTYGLGGKWEKLDYRLNPRTGFSIESSAGAGNKVITRNSKINKDVYDSLDLKTTQYNGEFTGDVYFPIANRSVINIGAQGAYLYSPEIFENELFRFGGLRSLRGFNEQSLLASRYIMGKAEYRFILEQNSYLFTFFNGAYYENHTHKKFIHDTPFGFGAGITFETKLGIFSFNYALGKEFNNPILFKTAKVHFGIVNYF